MTGDVHQDSTVLAVNFVSELFLHFSVLSRFLGAISWWRRLFLLFRNRTCRRRGEKEVSVLSGPISLSENTQSLSTVIHVAQKECCFPGVLEALETGIATRLLCGSMELEQRKYYPFLQENVS